MDVFHISGGRRIEGTQVIGGAKNAVLPALAAAIMTEKTVRIRRCPELLDVADMRKILVTLGCVVTREGEDIRVDAGPADSYCMPEAISKKIRSSIFMMGPIVARFGRATVTYPGGCDIGPRPIDLHIKGLRALGVKIHEAHGRIELDGKNLHGAAVHLDFPSVGATENIMMAAALAPGRTVIFNAAREPEIQDLERFINLMGGCVSGASAGKITIDGVKKLGGADYTPIPDRIVAGTLLTAAAITGGRVTLSNARPDDMRAVIDKLECAGCQFDLESERVTMTAPRRVRPVIVSTQPYPGFPTDMQSQITALMCVADGTGVVVENVFENRFGHAAELMRMGAKILISGRVCVVRGGPLNGATVCARDLRCGAALTLAGLAAEGVTRVEGVSLIDRGYAALENMLASMGADIRRERETEIPTGREE